MGAARSTMARLFAVAAPLAITLSVASTVRAAEGDLEARVRALEERIEKLAKAVEERDAEIARLREELEDRDAPHWPDPRGRAPDEPIERWRDQLGHLDEGMRRELERWGMDWGLPGRSFKRMPGPIELMPTRRAFLGIEMEEGERGVQVANVVVGSPAEGAGLEPGDLIVEIDGRQVFRAEEVARLVGSRRPGDALTVTVERDGNTLNLGATLAAPSGGRGRFRVPEFRVGPFGGGGGQDELRPGPGPGQDQIDVDVPVPGGRARVRFSAPGLFLSEQLAKQLDLTERERRHVEDALAEARGGLAGKLADEVRKSGGRAETATVARLRREAEAAARGLLAGKLPEAKLAALERAQAKAASESRVSVSVRSSSGTGGTGGTGGVGDAGDEGPGERRVEDPLEKLFERAQEF